MKSQTMRGATAHRDSAETKNRFTRPSEKNGGSVSRARQITQRDLKASKTKSSAKLAVARSVERPSEKNGGSASRARQIAQRDLKASKAKSSAKLAAARSVERPSEKNGGSASRARQITQRDLKASTDGRKLATLEGTKRASGAVSRPSSFANPRKGSPVKSGSKPRITSTRPQKLAYRSGAGSTPRAGRLGTGRAGIVDPGGYVRTAQKGTGTMDRSHIQQQLKSISNYENNLSNNNRSRISNRGSWPNHWNPGAGSAGLGYYPSYSWNGTNYPFSYYALSGYCPTPYLFMLESGAFWQPGLGYADSLPYGYNQPMSIGVDEVVPAYDAHGHIIGYRDEMFYYNACWDPNAQAYGYYDYRGGFHWLTFPWLNTWNT
jgi:hypothetical protein